MPHWVQAYGSDDCTRLLDLIDGYLGGRMALKDVRRATDALMGALMNDAGGRTAGYLAGRAVAAAGWVAVGDELLSLEAGVTQAELDEPEDPDQWDPAFFASCAEAGGLPGGAEFDAAAHRAFWRDYLDVLVRAWAADGK